jgi:hypothetical protein
MKNARSFKYNLRELFETYKPSVDPNNPKGGHSKTRQKATFKTVYEDELT